MAQTFYWHYFKANSCWMWTCSRRWTWWDNLVEM